MKRNSSIRVIIFYPVPSFLGTPHMTESLLNFSARYSTLRCIRPNDTVRFLLVLGKRCLSCPVYISLYVSTWQTMTVPRKGIRRGYIRGAADRGRSVRLPAWLLALDVSPPPGVCPRPQVLPPPRAVTSPHAVLHTPRCSSSSSSRYVSICLQAGSRKAWLMERKYILQLQILLKEEVRFNNSYLTFLMKIILIWRFVSLWAIGLINSMV